MAAGTATATTARPSTSGATRWTSPGPAGGSAPGSSWARSLRSACA
uniref:Uncharacterized protein n=1 Tax=Arundo donax TaxID=35708 RepID=A0A0A8YIW4_ARUDO